MTGADNHNEQGVILPSVLVMLALASAVVMMMITLQDVSIQRSTRFNEAAQALAYAQGGELSAIIALRRDALEAPGTDNLTEAWAAISDSGAAIDNGTFSVSVGDAQSRFNINNLAGSGLAGRATFDKLLSALELPPSTGVRIMAFLAANGPVRHLGDLQQAGLTSRDIAVLSQMTVALPIETEINLNTAGEALIAALLANRAAATQLMAQRRRQGYLTPADTAAARIVLPPGAGFTSDFFEVHTSVTIGDTAQSISTLLQRVREDQNVRVIPIDHTRTKTAPSLAPPSN